MNELVRIAPTRTLVAAELIDTARAFAANAKAENTRRRAYQCDWKSFLRWAKERKLQSLPAAPTTVALYAAALAKDGLKPSTISRAIVSISQAHKLAGSSPRRVAEVIACPELALQRGHSEAINSMVFTEDGRTIITAGADHSVRSFDIPSGLEVASNCDWTAQDDVSLQLSMDAMKVPAAHAAGQPASNVRGTICMRETDCPICPKMGRTSA